MASERDAQSSSHKKLHWAPLRSWNLFPGRDRSRISEESHSSQLPRSSVLQNSSRNCRRLRFRESTHKRFDRTRRGQEQRSREVSSRQGGASAGSEQLLRHPSAPISRRQALSDRTIEALNDFSVMVRRARHNTHSVHHQQHHYHDHHHHHFHYHHFHHQSSSSANEHQDQDSRTSSAIDNDLPIHQNQINGHQRRLLTNGRTSFSSNSRIGANSQIAAIEARDRLDERLRGIRHMRNRAVLGGFFDNLGFHLGNEEDVCIDDEIWELGIQDWLTTWGYDEPQQMDLFSVPKGLSKAAIRSLPKEYFVPQVPQNNSEVEDAILEQNDCSVCLEHFKVGQVLICLPCKHRFHQECLIPWLESHGQCPYCRAKICKAEAHGQSSRSSLAQQENNDDLLAWLTIS